MEQEPKRLRRLLLMGLSVCLCLVLIVTLWQVQVTDSQTYVDQATSTVLRTSTVKAIRGEVFDRYGRPLIENRTCYNLYVDKTAMGDRSVNDLLLQAVRLLEAQQESYADNLPISSFPYDYTVDLNDTDSAKAKRLSKLITAMELTGEPTAGQTLQALADRYGISDEGMTQHEWRAVISLRYEMENLDYSLSNPFEIATDVSVQTVTKVAEYPELYQGLTMQADTVREYTDGTFAAHLLGWTGSIYKEEYEQLKEKGYAMNDKVGKSGVEKAFEDYLRGQDGKQAVEQNILGEVVGTRVTQEAVPGDNVVLTLDRDLQQVAQTSLAATIQSIAQKNQASGKPGYDADAGAVVVLDINSGELLASASYPSYNLSTFSQDYDQLYSDETKPMYNRAFQGTYEPGSTFKMLTAIAGLEEGVITTDTKITCTGIYEYFASSGYRPRCWIYNQYGTTHGTLTVKGAIEKSCNIFFFEVGRRLGIDRLDDYAKLFGFGQKTGVELSESTGVLAGRETSFESGQSWFEGQTIQAAIGQSDNLFTPLQLCNYIATIANGGTRYQIHLLKSVRDYITGEQTVTVQPTVMDQLEIDSEVLGTVVDGMRRVTEDGTASSVFSTYWIPVAGKTGSAEVPTGSANGVFVAFAPADDPQIAVAIVVEHGAHGNSVATVAKDIFDCYFSADIDQHQPLKSGNILN